MHSTGIDNEINISNFYRITLTPDNSIDYVKFWGDELILNANYIKIKLGNPDTDIGECYVILDYMVI